MEVLLNKLVAEDKQFEMLSYPNRTHAIEDAKGPNTRKHLFDSITRFFLRSIPPAPVAKM
jgi:dipeptidyl-peptidase-4